MLLPMWITSGCPDNPDAIRRASLQRVWRFPATWLATNVGRQSVRPRKLLLESRELHIEIEIVQALVDRPLRIGELKQPCDRIWRRCDPPRVFRLSCDFRFRCSAAVKRRTRRKLAHCQGPIWSTCCTPSTCTYISIRSLSTVVPTGPISVGLRMVSVSWLCFQNA